MKHNHLAKLNGVLKCILQTHSSHGVAEPRKWDDTSILGAQLEMIGIRYKCKTQKQAFGWPEGESSAEGSIWKPVRTETWMAPWGQELGGRHWREGTASLRRLGAVLLQGDTQRDRSQNKMWWALHEEEAPSKGSSVPQSSVRGPAGVTSQHGRECAGGEKSRAGSGGDTVQNLPTAMKQGPQSVAWGWTLTPAMKLQC